MFLLGFIAILILAEAICSCVLWRKMRVAYDERDSLEQELLSLCNRFQLETSQIRKQSDRLRGEMVRYRIERDDVRDILRSVSNELLPVLQNVKNDLFRLWNKIHVKLGTLDSQQFQYMITSTNDARRVLQRLVDWSVCGNRTLTTRLDTRAIVEEAVSSLRDSGQDIRFDIRSLPFVEGDPVSLKLLFRSLISLAIRDCGDDGVITVATRNWKNQIQFLIGDKRAFFTSQKEECSVASYLNSNPRGVLHRLTTSMCEQIVLAHEGDLQILKGYGFCALFNLRAREDEGPCSSDEYYTVRAA